MPARLHHERIARSTSNPSQWLAMVHGIYGAGSNWRSIARKLNQRRPEWGVVLVDLRQHGRSENGEPPHTLAACADDLRALFSELRGELGDITAIAGHSFGGKVALSTRRILELRQTWVLDASPSARRGPPGSPTAPPTGGTVLRVLELMERSPRYWASREEFVAAIMADGHDEGLARWLAMSLIPAPTGGTEPSGGLVLRFDVHALRAMLDDYFDTDLWDVLEAPGHDVEVVIATRSSTVSEPDRGRLAAAPAHVHVHQVDADHWLHIEAPDRVIELFAERLP